MPIVRYVPWFALLAWSAALPRDRLTWLLDALPALAFAAALLASERRFPLTPLARRLVWLLCAIILIGAHYSFEKVPLFDWIRDYAGGSRNRFDKFAHFFQGLVPAIVLREIFIRLGVVSSRRWLAPIVAGLSLAVSALYELLEWAASVVLGEAAAAFVGAQGDAWDAQGDMAMALLGAVCALSWLSRVHDRQLRTLPDRQQS